VYLGVQNNAKDASVRSDVSNLKTAVVSAQTNDPGNALPAAFTATKAGDVSATLTTAGATFGDNTASLQLGKSADGFCIIAVSKTDATKKFYATQSAGVNTTACTITTT
jgi:type IV pilus assembly protein PilA